MRKYVMLAMVAIFMFGTAFSAQGQPQQRHNRTDKKEVKQDEKKMITPEKRAEFLAKQLELTDAEKAKVQDMFVKQDAKVEQHMEEVKKIREEQKTKFEAERKSRDAELIKIIGNEKFQKMQAQRIQRLEKENMMMKMRMMQKNKPNEHQKIMMEKMKKAKENKDE
jgi:periplasmic protein CpxP/Spy